MTNTSPKVTISIPVYNQEKFVAKAIESALSQDYEHLEINISDDASSDGTWAICEDYKEQPRINIYRNHTNLGRLANYSQLLYQYATGEWVVNLDGDDFFTDKGFISNAIKLIEQTNNVVLYHANFFDIQKFKKFVKKSFSNNCKLLSGTDYVLNRCFVDHFYHLSALYKRTTAIQAGFYSYDCLNSDALSLRTIALFGEVILDSKEVGKWQLTEQSETHKSASQEEINRSQKANEQYEAVLNNHFSQAELLQYHANLSKASRRIELYNSIENRNFVDAKRLLLEKVEFNKFYIRQVVKYLLYKIGLKE
jgi:glycosyltransferase involved in cell wall biosynthesis